MANNTTLNAGTGGDIIRDIEKGGAKTQVVIVDIGGTGAESLFTGNLPNIPRHWEIAEGNVTGQSAVVVGGYNPAVNNVMEDMLEFGGTYTYPPAGGIQMAISSTSAQDNAAGTGARSIDISVLLADYTVKEITIIPNGLTPVLTVDTNILRINDMHNMSAGSGGVAAGDISLKNVAGTITYSFIGAGLNVSRQSIYTVPIGKNFYITSWGIGIGGAAGNKHASFFLRATTSKEAELLPVGIFHVRDEAQAQDSGRLITCEFPIKVLATSDIKISVIGDAGNDNSLCSGTFKGYLK